MALIDKLRASGAKHAQPENAEPSHAPGFSRRDAIGLIGAAGLVSVAGPAFALGYAGKLPGTACDVWLDSTHHSVQTLRHAHWQQMIGDGFIIEGAPFDDIGTQPGTILTLQQATGERKVNDVHRPAALDRSEAISLLFLSESTEQLANATYALTHARLGRIELFLHEFPADTNHLIYEAILN